MLAEAVRITADEAVAALKGAAWTEHINEDKYEAAVEAVRATCRETGEGEVVPVDDVLAAIERELGTPRTLIHCFLGGLGADWDLDGAIELVRSAEKVGWVPNIFRHELGALKDGKLYCFQASAPEPAEATA